MEGIESCTDTDCTVSSNGQVSCISPCHHTAYCEAVNYIDWPFDIQTCSFEFMSRTRDINLLKLLFDGLSIEENGFESQDWMISVSTSNSGERSYLFDNHNSSHPYFQFDFKIKRHTKRFACQVLIPAVLLVMINLGLLLLNPESSGRVVLYVISLFSHMIFIEQLYYL